LLTVTEFELPNVALAPLDGATNVTANLERIRTKGIGDFRLKRAAERRAHYRTLRVPETVTIDCGGAAILLKSNVAGVPSPATVAVTV
jgi:hypothetical protein